MQALTITQIKQMYTELRARVEKVTSKYLEERNVNATVKDLESFINTTIQYDDMKHENNCFTVRISAKADHAIKIVHKDAVSDAVTTVGATVGGCVGSVVGAPFGFAGVAAGAATGAAAGATVGAGGVTALRTAVGYMVGGGGVRDYKDSFTAEEIFRLLETDGFEKQNGLVKCTVRLT